jgi:hypothetical protein
MTAIISMNFRMTVFFATAARNLLKGASSIAMTTYARNWDIWFAMLVEAFQKVATINLEFQNGVGQQLLSVLTGGYDLARLLPAALRSEILVRDTTLLLHCNRSRMGC